MPMLVKLRSTKMFKQSFYFIIIYLSAIHASSVMAQDWQLNIGAGLITTPKSQAFESYNSDFLPILDIQWRKRLFLSIENGVGVHFYRDKNWVFTASINYDQGRKESSDKVNLKGLGDINEAAVAAIKLKFDANIADAYFSVNKNLRSSGGMTAKLGLASLIPIDMISQSNHLLKAPQLFIDVSTVWADSQYNNLIFGVSPKQSKSSGLTPYNINRGFNAAQFEVGLFYPLYQNWSLNTILGQNYWLNGAKSSPIVKHSSALNGKIFLLYQF